MKHISMLSGFSAWLRPNCAARARTSRFIYPPSGSTAAPGRA